MILNLNSKYSVSNLGISSDTGLYDYGERSHSRKSSQPNELKSPSEGSGTQQVHHHRESHSSPYAEVSAAEAAMSSTENLLRNIQGLLKVAAENAKQQERRISVEKGTIYDSNSIEHYLLLHTLCKTSRYGLNLRTNLFKNWKHLMILMKTFMFVLKRSNELFY